MRFPAVIQFLFETPYSVSVANTNLIVFILAGVRGIDCAKISTASLVFNKTLLNSKAMAVNASALCDVCDIKK